MEHIFFIFLAFLCGGHAMTEKDVKLNFFKYVSECLKDHPVTMAELADLKALAVPEKSEVKCLVACAHKKEGVLDDKGLYVLEHAYKLAEIIKNGDEKRLENGRKMAELCAKVNDIEVSDGEKGCERAGLIFKCAIENALKYGFVI